MNSPKSKSPKKIKSTNVQTVQRSKTYNEEELLRAKLALLEKEKELKEKLPHKYGFNLYKFQKEYVESTAKISLIVAGNQIGKSSCNIIKMITLATEPELWPKFFPHRRPIQFWFLMPTKDLITTEFRTKWVPEFLPKGEYKDHPQYGWKEEIRSKHLWALHFNTGVSIYMHTYEQDVFHLQAGTIDALFVDEEPPWDLMPELMMRTTATQGLTLQAVMTPTRGQEMWRRVFEVRGDGEIFPEAFKQQVSVYDCMQYADGRPSAWTNERIQRLLNSLGTQQEIDLRIHGRFVAQDGLILSAFHRDKNVNRKEPIPSNWMYFSGVDLGGGGSGSLPAIVFIAVSPNFQSARVTEVWKGSSNKVYTASDVMDRYIEMRQGRPMIGQYYDFSSKDFGTISDRVGAGFEKADKSREVGFPMLNTLFKNQMLNIDENPDNHALITEILNLRHDSNKRSKYTQDHLCDALRYAAVKIPWNFEGITGEKIVIPQKRTPTHDELRRGDFVEDTREVWAIESDFNDFNDMSDPDWS
jgi:phage terminase large subunit-like protein